jgi:hypothetical protein
MAEQIANDPSFMGMTQQLQESMGAMAGMMGAGGGGMMGGGAGGGGGGDGPAGPGLPGGMPDPANFDPSKYMQAMSGMFQNPSFMQMAEKLGQAIIQVGEAGVGHRAGHPCMHACRLCQAGVRQHPPT